MPPIISVLRDKKKNIFLMSESASVSDVMLRAIKYAVNFCS